MPVGFASDSVFIEGRSLFLPRWASLKHNDWFKVSKSILGFRDPLLDSQKNSPLKPQESTTARFYRTKLRRIKGPVEKFVTICSLSNLLNPELNPICCLLALLGAHHFLHVSRIRVKSLTFRRLMSYIYGAPILDVSSSHTTTQHSR